MRFRDLLKDIHKVEQKLGGDIIYSQHPIGRKRAFFTGLRMALKEGHYELHCCVEEKGKLTSPVLAGLEFDLSEIQ